MTSPYLCPPCLARLIECRRRRCALLLGLIVGVALGLALALGVITVREALELLASKALELGLAAALVAAGVRS